MTLRKTMSILATAFLTACAAPTPPLRDVQQLSPEEKGEFSTCIIRHMAGDHKAALAELKGKTTMTDPLYAAIIEVALVAEMSQRECAAEMGINPASLKPVGINANIAP